VSAIYFQPPDIKSNYVEVGIISDIDPEHIWYINEPCKVLISDVKIIHEKQVYFDKKKKLYKIKNLL
jgi:hypothetical protein